MITYLITGGAGFIGINFVKFLLNKNENLKIIVLDKLTYAANKKELNKILQTYKNLEFIKGDICNKKIVSNIFLNNKIDFLINFAAESHVDRSINSSYPFYKTNVLGTINLLEISKKYYEKENKSFKFIQISTDEVYGSVSQNIEDKYFFDEDTKLNPTSPYSSSKAAADLACISFFKTFNFPIIITRSANNFGEFQNVEKFLPKVISNIYKNKDIPIYGNGSNIRDWLYVKANCQAIDFLSKNGKLGEIYNISNSCEISNINLIEFIKKKYFKEKNINLKFVEDRKAHDFRYSINNNKLKNLGFEFDKKYSFEYGMDKTVQFYIGG